MMDTKHDARRNGSVARIYDTPQQTDTLLLLFFLATTLLVFFRGSEGRGSFW